jgi:hypothetical protein
MLLSEVFSLSATGRLLSLNAKEVEGYPSMMIRLTRSHVQGTFSLDLDGVARITAFPIQPPIVTCQCSGRAHRADHRRSN